MVSLEPLVCYCFPLQIGWLLVEWDSPWTSYSVSYSLSHSQQWPVGTIRQQHSLSHTPSSSTHSCMLAAVSTELEMVHSQQCLLTNQLPVWTMIMILSHCTHTHTYTHTHTHMESLWYYDTNVIIVGAVPWWSHVLVWGQQPSHQGQGHWERLWTQHVDGRQW